MHRLLSRSFTTLLFSMIPYGPFNLSFEDVQGLLSKTITFSAPLQQERSDITYLCADVKYDNGIMKFCEIGDAVHMSFTRDMKLEISDRLCTLHAPGWGVFWNYLKHCGCPMWFIGNIRNYNAMAVDEFKRLGGRQLTTLDDLEKDEQFQQSLNFHQKNFKVFSDYAGILVYCAPYKELRDGSQITAFKKRYPEILVVNSALCPVVASKTATYKVFHKAGLSKYIPKTKAFSKVLTSETIATMVRSFSSPYLIIKPRAGTCSEGVVMIERELLVPTITWLFDKKNKYKRYKEPWFAEWRKDRDTSFLLSEYAPSQVLERGGKLYDPTMRILAILRYDNGQIYVTVLGAFWKIPPCALSDNASLTEKHITRAHLVVYDPDEFFSGILVQRHDMQQVKNILHACLPPFYAEILKMRA